jgi:hypothetical protein
VKCYRLMRDEDVTGASGEGHVADVVEFDSGKVVVAWRSRHASIVVWDALEHAMAVHGHGGKTRLVPTSAT